MSVYMSSASRAGVFLDACCAFKRSSHGAHEVSVAETAVRDAMVAWTNAECEDWEEAHEALEVALDAVATLSKTMTDPNGPWEAARARLADEAVAAFTVALKRRVSGFEAS